MANLIAQQRFLLTRQSTGLFIEMTEGLGIGSISTPIDFVDQNCGNKRSIGEIMFCSKCGTDNQGAAFCSSCGSALAPAPAPTYSSPAPMQAKASNGLSTAAIVLGAIGLLFVPLVFGTASLILAIVAKTRKEPRANIALAVGIVSLLVGVILGAIVGAATFDF